MNLQSIFQFLKKGSIFRLIIAIIILALIVMFTMVYHFMENPPTDLTAEVYNGSEVAFVLTWQDNTANENGFRILRSSNGSDYEEVNTVEADVVTYLVPERKS